MRFYSPFLESVLLQILAFNYRFFLCITLHIYSNVFYLLPFGEFLWDELKKVSLYQITKIIFVII